MWFLPYTKPIRLYCFTKYLWKFEDFQLNSAILSAHLQRRIFEWHRRLLQGIYTWNTSFVCAGAVGIIQIFFKLIGSLRKWITFRIFFSWAQWFACHEFCSINMVTLTSFCTIGCDNGLVGIKCLMVAFTKTT